MSYSIFDARPTAATKTYYEFAIDFYADLATITEPGIADGSIAFFPNGMKYRYSANCGWTYDASSYGGALDLTTNLPHTLNLTAGTGSTLAVAIGATAQADGDLVYSGDSLTVTYAADTGYEEEACFINGVAASSSPATFVVPVGGDVFIESSASIQMFELTLTVGENTTLTVVDASDNEYADGDMIPYGTELTVTAAAADGFTLSTFTINTVAKTSPASHTATDAVTIVTAATEA
jgi:hypothetical protein